METRPSTRSWHFTARARLIGWTTLVFAALALGAATAHLNWWGWGV